jgi:hypothetical protein
MADHALAVVHNFSDRFEADLAKSALDAAGIEAFVHGDDAGGMRPGLWMGRGVQIVVRVEDLERAREVLDIPSTPA